MILTGKALRRFNRWLFISHSKTYHTLNEIELYAYIIEWFDSVGVIVNSGGVILNGVKNFSFDIQTDNTLNGIDSYGYNTRNQSTEQAIIKAKDIYNERT